MEKYNRLRKVHKGKEDSGIPTTTFRNRDNDDMYSEVSVTSKAASSYTMSTTTGMRKKKDKKRSVLTRNVKEGSPLEEEYLLAYLKMLEDKVEESVSKSICYLRGLEVADPASDLHEPHRRGRAAKK
jgi:elongator complex protein 1